MKTYHIKKTDVLSQLKEKLSSPDIEFVDIEIVLNPARTYSLWILHTGQAQLCDHLLKNIKQAWAHIEHSINKFTRKNNFQVMLVD